MTDESSIAFLHRLLITHQPICDLAGFILTFLRAQRLHSNRILIPSMSKPPWQMWLCIGAGAVALLGYKLLAARQPAKLKTRIVDTASELHALCQDIVLQLNALSSEELVVAGLDTEWANKEEVALLQIAVLDWVLLIRPRLIRSACPEALDECHQLKQLLAHPRLIVSGSGIGKDISLIRQQLGLPVAAAVVEVQTVAKRESHLQLTKLGLAGLAFDLLGVTMNKDPAVRCGDWTANPLSTEQLSYAADDAIYSRDVLMAMFERRTDPNMNLRAGLKR